MKTKNDLTKNHLPIDIVHGIKSQQSNGDNVNHLIEQWSQDVNNME